jgi:hypothetical protein
MEIAAIKRQRDCRRILGQSSQHTIRDRSTLGARNGPGLYVGVVFVRRQRRRDLEVPEGLDDRADLEARRHLCGPEHER